MPTIPDLAELRALEESLWKVETRFDRAYMERVLAEDYLELDRSGAVHRLDDVLQYEREELAVKLPLERFEGVVVGPDVVLLTYRSEVTRLLVRELTNRSSLWVRGVSGWQLRFHQGTPVTEGE